MDTSHLLARVLGMTFIVMYGGLLINHKFYRRIFQKLPQEELGLLLSGFIALIIGLLIIQVHSIWTFDWRGLITLFGWLIFLQGVVRILFPEQVLRLAQKIVNSKNSLFLTSASIIMFLIGLYLAYHGFMTTHF